MDLRFLNDECFICNSADSFSYDDSYFERYRERTYSEMGVKLTKFRKAYVECFANDGEILDFGTGFGELVVADTLSRWAGYDVNPRTQDRLGRRFDEDWLKYKNICLFDVLEHLQQPDEFLQSVKSDTRLFITIPLWNGDWQSIPDSISSWKHWKPCEHCLYASLCGFRQLMSNQSYLEVDYNTIESSLGRVDSHTFVFQKCQRQR